MPDAKRPKGALTQEEYFHESQQLYADLLREPPRTGWLGALVIALLLHGVVFALHFDAERPPVNEPRAKQQVVVSHQRIPPPPKMRKPKDVVKPAEIAKKFPIPDPDPEEPEPIKAFQALDEPNLDIDVDIVIETGVGLGSTGFMAAKPIYRKSPDFPPIVKQAGIPKATVKVLLTVGPDGKVKDLTWLEGMPVYREAVEGAIYQWRFDPATKDGKAVEYTWAQTFVFLLE